MVVDGEKFPMPGFYDIEMPDCLQLTLKQTYLSQVCLNRFFYLASGEMGAPANIGNNWWTSYGAKLKPIQANDLTYDLINITILFGTRWSYDYTLTAQTGSNEGDPLPAFMGSRFKLFPQYSRVRKGRKVFTAITESMVQGDDAAPGIVSALADVAVELSNTFTSDGIVFTPVLISPANTKHPNLSITPVTSATFVGWSTQSSRKIGRGT